MAQTTQITIDNQTFPSFRSKLNESLSALNSLNSGTSRPSSAVAGTIWLDTTNATNPTLKFFDGNDDISLATIDYTANTVNWLDSSVTLTSPVEISGNSTAGAEIRLPEDTDNGSNYVGLKASDSIASPITFTLPSADGTDGQALKTDGSGNLSFGDAGRLGTVNWDTTAKTSSFTAVSGIGYFINTTSTSITLTLPASPSAGDIVSFKDYAFTFATNNLTVDGNGSPIGGVDGNINPTYDTNGTSKTFIYVDGTKGWLVTNESTDTSQESNELYVTATGGTVTCCGDYKIHTFTGPGTFTVTCAGNPSGNTQLEYVVVAGGGGGGNSGCRGGGGGAGGFRFASPSIAPLTYPAKPLAGSTLTASVTSYPITVGGGGSVGSSGNNSVFSSITSAGGGFGGGSPSSGGSGGSGGGGAGPGGGQPVTSGGSGNTPPVSPSQGNNGGPGDSSPPGFGGGGGGALAIGSTGASSPQPRGADGGIGAGLPTAFGSNGESCGSFRYYAGGAGAGYYGDAVPGGLGGTGGGGNGGGFNGSSGTPGTAGTTNTGGGGGGGTLCNVGASAGGSGIVIIRYKFQQVILWE